MLVWQGPIATDNSGVTPTVMCAPASGTDFVIGKMNVTCTALDGFGNVNNCSFYVDVKDIEDPVLESCPANQTVNTDPGKATAMIVCQGPIATDNSGVNPAVVCDPASGTDFVIGKMNVTCTAVDGFGNVNNCSFYVDVKDNEGPVLESCPSNQTTNTDPGQPTAMIVWQGPIATDNSNLSPTVMCDPASGTDVVIGITQVTCAALDGFGNVNNCSFYVDVKDNEGPVLESCPANQTTNTDPGQPTAMIVWQGPIATDNSGLSPTVMCDPASGTDFVIGITQVTCAALDGFGNANNCSFYVDVKDNEGPVLESCPANQTTNTDPGQPTAMIVWQGPIATDNSGLSTTVMCDPASGTDFVIGITQVTCAALDGFGNANNCSFYVDVKDIRSIKGKVTTDIRRKNTQD
ncbi:hyalin-like [Amphiura filiformis]|uniref:hyalin-like n=1 Tax=Amphiura filiformis TaxID=82378 RepID=UPI003B21785B